MPEIEIVKEFFDWLRTGASGCLFARALATQSASAKWRTTIVQNPMQPDLGKILNQWLLESIENGDEVRQFFFPDVIGSKEIASLIKTLCLDTNWIYTEIYLDSKTDSVAIALRWRHPNPAYINWVIGFANIPTMPPTRRAPSLSIIVRTGMPNETAGIAKGILAKGSPNYHEVEERERDFGKIPIHVADVPPLLENEKQIVSLWKGSQQSTHERLRNFEPKKGTKAKMTFILQGSLWNQHSDF